MIGYLDPNFFNLIEESQYAIQFADDAGTEEKAHVQHTDCPFEENAAFPGAINMELSRREKELWKIRCIHPSRKLHSNSTRKSGLFFKRKVPFECILYSTAESVDRFVTK